MKKPFKHDDYISRQWFREQLILPITDPEATVTYHCIYKKAFEKKLEPFFSYFDEVQNDTVT